MLSSRRARFSSDSRPLYREASSIGYQSSCDFDYPCFTTFQPSVAKVVGNVVLQRVANDGGRICDETAKALATVTLPLTEGNSDAAAGESTFMIDSFVHL